MILVEPRAGLLVLMRSALVANGATRRQRRVASV
jgi:hypothetical protein